MNGLQARNRELTIKNDELARLSEDAAGKKRDYLIAMSGEKTRLKLLGESVTLIRDMVKGKKPIADLQYQWDVAEGVLFACRERIKDLRESIGTYRSLLTWLRAELLNKE